MSLLSPRELAHIKIAYAWVAAHADDLRMDYLLSPHNIDRFLIFPTRLHNQGQEFMFIDTIPIFPLEPTEKSRQGVVIALEVREQRTKRRNKGGKGKGKRS